MDDSFLFNLHKHLCKFNVFVQVPMHLYVTLLSEIFVQKYKDVLKLYKSTYLLVKITKKCFRFIDPEAFFQLKNKL